MSPAIFNSICYSVGWFWCVLLGIRGHPIVALGGAIFLILLQLLNTKLKNLQTYTQDFFLVIFSVPLGILLEIFLIKMNVISYTNHAKFLPPIWIILLYPLFSLLLNHSLKIMKKKDAFPFLFGFFGAPLSYLAGEKLGGLTFPHHFISTWIILGTCWGLFLCLLARLAKGIEKAATETFAERDSKDRLELLYDGDCPICKQEICMLQKMDRHSQIKYVNIAAREYAAKEHGGVDYDTAMAQMHAIDGKGNLLTGLSAFAALYAKSGMTMLSTFLRIPFVRSLLTPAYALFAEKRLWLTRRKPKH